MPQPGHRASANPLMMFEKNHLNDNHNYRQQKHKK
jgi:hypothetical protein